MTLLYLDGFDAYAVSADFETGNRWNAAGTSALTTTGGARGGGGITSVSGTQGVIGQLPATHDTLITGFWWKMSALPSNTRDVLRYSRGGTAAGNTQVNLRLDVVGRLVMYLDASTTPLGWSRSLLLANTWYFIEWKVNMTNTGSAELRINGYTEFSFSGVDCQAEASSGADNVVIGSGSTNITQTYDDIYVLNDSGSSPWNNFLGPLYIDQITPSGDNTVVGTPSAGSNYQCVDETTTNGDTDYVSFNSSGQIDLYDMNTLSVTPTSIFAVQPYIFVRDDGVSVNTRTKMKNGTTTSNGTSRATTTSYQMWVDIYETNPDTTSAWTKTNIDNIITGVEFI